MNRIHSGNSAAPAGSDAPRRVLVVDGDEVGNFIISKQVDLHQLPLKVTFKTNAFRALAYLMEADQAGSHAFPDVVLIGQRAPYANGFELLESYNALFRERHPHTQLYLLSTIWRDQDALRANRYPFLSGVWSKPASHTQLQTLGKVS